MNVRTTRNIGCIACLLILCSLFACKSEADAIGTWSSGNSSVTIRTDGTVKKFVWNGQNLDSPYLRMTNGYLVIYYVDAGGIDTYKSVSKTSTTTESYASIDEFLTALNSGSAFYIDGTKQFTKE